MNVVMISLKDEDTTFLHVKGGGELEARSLYVEADVIDVDTDALIQANYMGVTDGAGAGTNRGGGSYGGRGGLGTVGGWFAIYFTHCFIKPMLHDCTTYVSAYYCNLAFNVHVHLNSSI